MALSYVICFFFLSKCLNEFNSIGFVYAIWSGVGIVLISLLGVFFFNEILTFEKLLGFIIIWFAVIIYLNELRKE